MPGSRNAWGSRSPQGSRGYMGSRINTGSRFSLGWYGRRNVVGVSLARDREGCGRLLPGAGEPDLVHVRQEHLDRPAPRPAVDLRGRQPAGGVVFVGFGGFADARQPAFGDVGAPALV